MNTMTISRLLDRLEETINNGKKQMFSSNMRLVDANTCLGMLQQIRGQLPNELAEATLILRDCDSIKAEAEKEAQAIIEEAKQDAMRLVAESEIIQEAQRQASELVNNAGIYADNLVEQSFEQVNSLYLDVENSMRDMLNKVYAKRNSLYVADGGEGDGDGEN
ncbi:MAG: hypothetical protein K2M75_03600 [Clostridia bacterium]|nr:hypothetical protein [Clostridia bacterium]